MSNRSLARSIVTVFSVATFTFLAACQSTERKADWEIVHLRLDTPSAGWAASPLEVWETETSVVCLFQLQRPEGMAAQVISSIEASMRIEKSPKPKRIAVLGKSWAWGERSDLDFPKDLASFRSALSSKAKRLEFEEPAATEDK